MVEQDINKFGKENANTINALAINADKAAKKFDNLTQSYKDNADALKDEKKGTREYGLALGNLTKAAKVAFGNNENITEEFVGKHLDLFKDFSEGVEGSEKAIRQALVDTAKDAG
jgi:hypothetical protein